MITPVAALLALCLLIYVLHSKKSNATTEPIQNIEYTGNYTLYDVDYNDQEQTLTFVKQGTGKFILDRSRQCFAFHTDDRLIFYRNAFERTMNDDLEERFTFTDARATCYWKQNRLVLTIDVLNNGRISNQYELTGFNDSTWLDF
jgi:hypothetical protein